ncbi:amidohydrolase [Mesorhizobium amorphae]|uniref:Amidohydrolase n=1 Tax=Mesorhizobium amorphae CCNWGS0123 TaxID=1082933 RepID=G6YEL8_9HYPH|nr:amidohydrolase [Mesorhizobium amorphae]ANT53341.1 hydrolase [Mesorhizobium amorphae CCNWGS0123]EHH09827.1 amidohydrolase [Mesorhizobium amorphae CCNWGS0123]GLR41255.1 amidohydrolase [Mesorhizobium amorphae]
MPPSADLIVENASILTMDPDTPRAEAIAIKGGDIIAIADRASVLDYKGPGTRVIDAGGGSVLPGFIEAHMHLFGGAAELDNLHLAGVHGFDALRDAIRPFASARPNARLLLGAGVDYSILSSDEPVTRHHLDRIIPDRPFAMSASDHHTMWANTKALEQAGILHGRQLGPGNEIVMGADGLAAGELREGEAFGPILEHFGQNRTRLGLTGGEPEPYPSGEELASDRDLMHRGLQWCAQHGITSIQNMDGNLYQLELLAGLEEEGRLLCRTKIPFHFKNFMALDILEKASRMAAAYKSEWLSSGMVKVFYDGVLDSWTAVMVDDYADRPGWRGEPLFTPEHFAQVAVEADRRGLQIAVHSIGDGAVRAVLDGYQAAQKANGKRDSRHRVEHIEVTTPSDVPRFAELGVIASMQPPHPPGAMNFPLEPTLSRIGREKWPLSYAWRALKNAGARVVFASDWPVSPVDPILGIQAAVMRKPWAEGLPDQSFSLHESIAGYTVEGAYAEFMERRKGRLKPGYMADLVVLSADIEATAPEALHTVRPVTTICGGKITYQA